MSAKRQAEIVTTLSSGSKSGQYLSDRFSVSRTALWKDIKVLRKNGFDIQGTPSKGYTLKGTPLSLNETSFAMELKTKIYGRPFKLLDETASTHDLAKKFAIDKATDGTLIAALSQSGGKGRLGRKWFSPIGGIWFSLVIKPEIPLRDLPKLGLLCAYSIVETFTLFGVKTSIKWPNDVIANGKKIAGILLEASGEPDQIDFLIISAGINLNNDSTKLPAEIRNISISALNILGNELSANTFLAELIYEFESQVNDLERSWNKLVRKWDDFDSLVNKTVTVNSGNKEITGVSKGINENGHLLLELGDGSIEELVSGEITTKLKVEDRW